MNRFEQLKEEIANMNLDDFMKNFVIDTMKDYICGGIRHPQAHCSNEDYVCGDCLRSYLESEVTK